MDFTLVVCYSHYFVVTGLEPGSHWVPVVTDPLTQLELIDSAHVVSGGHCGLTKTHKLLTPRCYWETMSKDVKKFVEECDRCQKSRVNKLMKGSEDLHPIPVPCKVWVQVGIDIMSMKEVDGYKYIITAMDYFSKNMEMCALQKMSAKEVAIFLYEDVIFRWGSPDIIITNQGREFCKAINDQLMERAHCKYKITSSYHPQCLIGISHSSEWAFQSSQPSFRVASIPESSHIFCLQYYFISQS